MKIKGSLTAYILDNIIEEIYYRGLDYADSERVEKLQETEKRLFAIVIGSKQYQVEFRQGPKYIKGYCDCPYFLSNDDYCKHIAAVAIAYDWSKGLEPPNAALIEQETIEVERNFNRKIEQIFKNPLRADLEFLANISAYSSWGVKPHAKISVHSTVENIAKNLTTQELIKGFKSISKTMARYNFHHYLCAGEISAVFAQTLDTVIFRLNHTQARIALKIFELCVIFYYEYLETIDGSDGVWQIPQARLPVIYQQLQEKGVNVKAFARIREHLNLMIDGWGDIFEDLGIAMSNKVGLDESQFLRKHF